ncbi:MAG: ATP-grasp domain-containing protein [Candidatus Dependentiae bacterium]|nr:ATP-grasp domain-containing protein [Candidatus Dependentiae bacterium]
MIGKLRVGVLMGGKSLEREVSLNSGRTIYDHLDTHRYDIVPLFQTEDNRLFILPTRFVHRGKISDFESRLTADAQEILWDDLKNIVDFVFIAQHGRFAEDGCLQGVLEVLGIPYLGSKILASALGMNKAMHKDMLAAAGIKVPHGIALTAYQTQTITIDILKSLLAGKKLSFPLIVKPEQEGSSFGISITHNMHELLAAIQQASLVYDLKPQGVLIEECIKGMEFSCIVITDYETGKLIPLTPTEIALESGYFNYEQKYMPGRCVKYTPARCAPENIARIQKECVTVMQLLGMTNLARIDGFLCDDGTIVITDPNSFAGMAPSAFTFLQAAHHHMSHTDFINHLIKTELRAYGITMHDTQHQEIDPKNRLRVGVLLGGRSNEKEISLESGRNVVYKLSPHKYAAIPLFVSSELKLYHIPQHILVCNSTAVIENQLTQDMYIPWHKLHEFVDFVFIGLHGGEGENGAIQGMLEMLGLPYNGSGVLASALCMDKYQTNTFLGNKGFDIPQGILYQRSQWETQQLPELPFNYPVIIKPHDDGCSVLVSKAHNQEQLETQLAQFFSKSTKAAALIEECITGMELTVGVIGNHAVQALPPSQAVATAGILSIEEKFLPGAGENKTPAPLSDHALTLVKKTMEEVFTAVGCCGYARIDCFYQNETQNFTGKERVIILEINTLPALTPATCIFHQAAELAIKPMDFIDMIIELGLQAHQKSCTLIENKQDITSTRTKQL